MLRMEPTFQGNRTILIYISGCHSGEEKKKIFTKKNPDEIFQQIYVLIKPAHLPYHNLLGIFILLRPVWSILGGGGSKQGSTGGKCHMLSENVWFSWYKPSKYLILRERKK